jgi:hypothetical protein
VRRHLSRGPCLGEHHADSHTLPQRTEALPQFNSSGRASVWEGSAGVARLQDIDLVDPAVPAGARHRFGRRVRLDVGRRDDVRRAHVGVVGRVGRAGQAEGGAADDAGRDDRQGEVAGEAGGVNLSSPVSVDF